MRNIIIGVAGHIDHGKTTLIKNLTGIDTDTLPEEKKRGMTIDIGFSRLKFKSGKVVSLIDVPGHEKFIKNMLTGFSGVDFLILVIACDDGIMPQTEEHFSIAKLLGVKNGLIVLTKVDAVSHERYLQVKIQCQKYFEGSFLANAPMISTSMKNSQSYEKLKQILEEKIGSLALDNEKKFFRMDIDRVFSVKGFGCVVTGTIKSGEVSLGQNLILYPYEKNVKVKGIENHGEKKENLSRGNRCALNLSGIDSKDLKRGDTLVEENSIFLNDVIDCYLYTLSTFKKLKNSDKIHLNIGTDEITGKIKIFEKNVIKAGETGFIQILLDEKKAFYYGDRGIIRGGNPLTTLGGVKILNPLGKKLVQSKDRYNINYIENLKELNSLEISNIIETLIKITPFISKDSILKILGFKNLYGELNLLVKNKKVIEIENKYLHIESFDKILEELTLFLDTYHKNFPLKRGVSKDEVKKIFFKELNSKEYSKILNIFITEGKFKELGNYISLPMFKIKLSRDERNMKEEIFSFYKTQKFSLRVYKELLEKSSDKNNFEKIHKYMYEEGFIEYLGENYFILSGYLKESIKILKGYFEENCELTVAQMRKLLNNDRDSAILILKKIDSLKITKNIDGIRRLI